MEKDIQFQPMGGGDLLFPVVTSVRNVWKIVQELEAMTREMMAESIVLASHYGMRLVFHISAKRCKKCDHI